MTQSFRLENVGLINRDKKLSFKFNGVTYYGFEGDTLASALIANGIHLVGRSFKYHRPRGFFGAGVDEPYAIVLLFSNGETEPNITNRPACPAWATQTDFIGPSPATPLFP